MNRSIILLVIPLLPLFISMLWIKKLEVELSADIASYSKSVNEFNEVLNEICILKSDEFQVIRSALENEMREIERLRNASGSKVVIPDKSNTALFATKDKQSIINKTVASKLGVDRNQEGNFGYLDKWGDTILEYEFSQIVEFQYDHTDYLLVEKNSKFGAMTIEGEEFIPIHHRSLSYVESLVGYAIELEKSTRLGH